MKLRKKVWRAMKGPAVRAVAVVGIALVVLDNLPDMVRYLKMERM